VVVAARNEAGVIGPLLESLARQDYPADLLEIIIINDNSTDRTPIVVSEFIGMTREQPGPVIRLIYSPFPGKKRSIRYGVEKSSGELILTTDADCIFGPGWVSAHAAGYGSVQVNGHAAGRVTGSGSAHAAGYGSVQENGHKAGRGPGSADMIVGEVCQRPARGFVALFGMFEFSALQSVTEAAVIAGHPVMCSAANMSFRRDVYLRHSHELRDELPSGDDIFLLHAVRRAGGRVRFAGSKEAAVETAAAVSAAALLRQRARWASKTYYYSDAATLTLAAATAACNTAITAAAVASIISAANIPLLAAMYGLRLVPDYLIIARNIKKRGDKMPLVPFLLSELIYPFYFMAVAALSILPSSRRFGKR
jgi:cellulose synthase/poly-beta-1,6-N-acetylglucosamine synthase-like glycosyltransferase